MSSPMAFNGIQMQIIANMLENAGKTLKQIKYDKI